MRSLVPMMRNPAAWWRATLAVFSGKIPDWMVQIPAASVEAIKVSSSLPPDAAAAGAGMDICRVLDDFSVDEPDGYPGRGHPARDAVVGESNVAVFGEPVMW